MQLRVMNFATEADQIRYVKDLLLLQYITLTKYKKIRNIFIASIYK